MMIQLTNQAEDLLRRLYTVEVEGAQSTLADPDDRVLGELLRNHYTQYRNTTLTLTKEGKQAAELAIRRHRLAERLMHDVLSVRDQQMNTVACEFEHSLHHGIDEQICTLLGHPKTCPHGLPIPPGKCCRGKKGVAKAAITPLATMQHDEEGVIAYLSSSNSDTVQKLMALGVLPALPCWSFKPSPAWSFK